MLLWCDRSDPTQKGCVGESTVCTQQVAGQVWDSGGLRALFPDRCFRDVVDGQVVENIKEAGIGLAQGKCRVAEAYSTRSSHSL